MQPYLEITNSETGVLSSKNTVQPFVATISIVESSIMLLELLKALDGRWASATVCRRLGVGFADRSQKDLSIRSRR
jgi:hypothetical protein